MGVQFQTVQDGIMQIGVEKGRRVWCSVWGVGVFQMTLGDSAGGFEGR